ncbi:MAG: amino acid ABC transporter permease [Tenericutes bacterium HGW-Tenericutes-7]|nr:MAG: amino acid ABC transporter permease [Tenericutes bacterium HGW-Tenericutes-7]
MFLSIVGTVGGFILSLFLTVLRTQEIDHRRDNALSIFLKRLGKGFSSDYITVFRGTPMIVQAMIFYYGIAPLGISWWRPLVAGLFVVTLNTTAYIAEVIRSGINGVDKGQMEAARSLGFSQKQAMFQIVLPQAIKNSLPAIGNEFIVNLKDTAVLSVIGVVDIFKATQSATSSNYRIVEGFIIAAIIYLILTFFTSKVVSRLEKGKKEVKRVSANA